MANTIKNKESFCEAENRRFNRMMNLGWLPNSYKKIGITIAVISFFTLLASKFAMDTGASVKDLLRSIMLIGMLMIVMSKELVEDERIERIRNKAFAGSFILGIIFSLAQPFVNFAVENLFSDSEPFQDISAFQVIFIMITFYLMFLHLSKRNS